MQAIESAQIAHAALGADRTGQQYRPPLRQGRIAIGHHGGHAIERTAQNDHHTALIRLRMTHRHRMATEAYGSRQTQQSGAAGEAHGGM